MPAHGVATRSPAGVRDLARRLITDERIIIPIRHHSPRCAHAVRHAIERYSPSMVLVEGPRSFNSLIGALTDGRTVAPLAIYTYPEPSPRRSRDALPGAYYPFCDFSPELVALRTAAKSGIPSAFIDLEYTQQQTFNRSDKSGRTERRGSHPLAVLHENHLTFSERLRVLAARHSCRDSDELWEQLIECAPPQDDLLCHLERVTAYCALARDDSDAAALHRYGTAAREAEMAWNIRQAIANSDGPVLVVVGGFHAVGLVDILDHPPDRPRVRDISAGSAIVRYSFPRVDAINGYSAGITSPGWQQHNWVHLEADRPDFRTRATHDAVLEVAAQLRDAGHAVALPTVADACVHAQRLAELRDRPVPLRGDIVDAIRATFVKGDVAVEGAVVLESTAAVLTGCAVGVLPPDVLAPPLVTDVWRRVTAARLHVDDPIPRALHLALYRRPSHRATSRLLHQLALLDVPFATPVAGPDFVTGTDLHLVVERWSYHWSPATDAALVECSRYGNTLPDAVAERFAEAVADFSSGPDRTCAAAAAALAVRCHVLDVPGATSAVTAAVAAAVNTDPSFVSVAEAFYRLTMLHRFPAAPLAVHEPARLSASADDAFRRARYLARQLPAEEPAEVVAALVRLRDAVAWCGPAWAGQSDLLQMWSALASRHPAALVRGACIGLAFNAGALDAAEVSDRVRGMLSGTAPPPEAVGHLVGLLTTAREIAWQEPALIDVLGNLLATWSDADFTAVLPDLRLAFAELTPAETDRVAEAVGRRLKLAGPPEAESPLSESEVWDRAVLASQQAAELLAAQGLGDLMSSDD